MFCKFCGKEIGEMTKFCPNCGGNNMDAANGSGGESQNVGGNFAQQSQNFDSRLNYMQKKKGKGKLIGIAAVVIIIAIIAMSGGSKSAGQKELLNYLNGDSMKKLGELESKTTDSYSSVAGDHYTSDEDMYEEIDEHTSLYAKEWNSYAREMANDIEDEKILNVHQKYIDYTNKYHQAMSMILDAIEKQDYGQVTKANELIGDADKSALEYKTELKKLMKEYDVEFQDK